MKDHRLWIRLSEEEYKRLTELVEESGTGTMSGYIRACIKLLTDPEMATTYQNVVNDYIEFYLEDKKLDGG